MKTGCARLARAGGIACAVAAVVLPALSAAGQEAEPAPSEITEPDIRSAPVEIQRNADGTPERNSQAAIVSTHWAGFAVRYAQTGEAYTSASASWMVPKVTYYPGFDLEVSWEWVGVGGTCLDDSVLVGPCDNQDKTLIQVATVERVTPTGITYLARYEMLPAAAVTVPGVAIHPGDRVSGSVQCIADCSSPMQTWLISFANQTTGQSWQQSFTYASLESSAEWIEEAPRQIFPDGTKQLLPLADFDMAALGPQVMENGQIPTLNMPLNGYVMVNPWGQWANPSQSALGQNGFFNVCWYGTTPGSIPCKGP